MSNKITQSEIDSAIRDLFSVLAKTKFKHHVTGGFAAMIYGEPRFTYDLDLVIAVEKGIELDQLINLLSEDFFIQREAVLDAVSRKAMFQAVHWKTNFRIDFHVSDGKNGEFERSQTFQIIDGFEVPIISRFDAIISKLRWIKKGSHRSRQDVFHMLVASSSEEQALVAGQAAREDLTDILESVKRQEF